MKPKRGRKRKAAPVLKAMDKENFETGGFQDDNNNNNTNCSSSDNIIERDPLSPSTNTVVTSSPPHTKSERPYLTREFDDPGTGTFEFVNTARTSSSSKKEYEDESENPQTNPLEINENDLNTQVIDQSTLSSSPPSTTTVIQEKDKEEGDGDGQIPEEEEEVEEGRGIEIESAVDESQVKRYGTLVIWEGNSNEPVFKKVAVKKGRFYIVNCGEVKSSYPGRCNKPIEPHHHQHLAGGTTSGCTCCGGGCPTYNNTHYDPECTKRVNRRRPKGPKKVQLVTKEEHHKILNSFIEDKKFEPDFKVDSLFAPRDPRDDHNRSNNNNQQMTEIAPTRRTRLQNRMAPKANKHQHQQQHHHHHQQFLDEHQQHHIIENKQVVSFTVLGNEELIDDVAGYEMVESNTMSNDSDQSRDDQNPEFGIHLNSEDDVPSSSTGEQRTKRQYRARKPTNKGQQQCVQHLEGNPNSDFGEIPAEIMCDLTGKPRGTYTDLIERALQQSENGLTVSEIYNWISSNYPYFQVNDDRWKNSVRHNLSINPYFKKGDKASNGAGHLWVIAEEGKGIRPPMRRRSGSDNIMDIYDQGDMIPIRNETDRAISVILSEYAVASMQHNQQQQQQQLHHQQQQQSVLTTVDQQVQINEEPLNEQPPVTYIQIPNEIAIGNCTDNENCQQSQVICYENLPDGSYAIDLHNSNTQMNPDDMYTLTDFTDGNVIMVNIEDSSNTKHEEQMTERLELDDVFVSDFSVLNTDGNDLMTGSITNWL